MTTKLAREGVANVIHETDKKFFIIEEKTWYTILLEELELRKKKIYYRSVENLQDT
ncbi:MAG: hypothetical protein NZM25_00310 [Leptospiraceae bacterium]|nr:hypothetical protein [Leptospiraceae bacterium]MDW8306167.1 hypothetical protein [Leptospiraceae bacterium]